MHGTPESRENSMHILSKASCAHFSQEQFGMNGLECFQLIKILPSAPLELRWHSRTPRWFLLCYKEGSTVLKENKPHDIRKVSAQGKDGNEGVFQE